MSAQAKGLTLRPATREDASEIADLLNLISRDLNTTLETAAEVTQWFDLPRLQDVPEAELPVGATLRTFVPGDETAVYEAHMESFADHWGFTPEPYEEWATANLKRDDFDASLWLLAEADAALAGIVLCRLVADARGPIGWVSILGVRPRWRRIGLGSTLLRAAFRELHARGRGRIGLGVDGQNTTNAVALYERAGMRVVRRMNEYERVL